MNSLVNIQSLIPLYIVASLGLIFLFTNPLAPRINTQDVYLDQMYEERETYISRLNSMPSVIYFIRQVQEEKIGVVISERGQMLRNYTIVTDTENAKIVSVSRGVDPEAGFTLETDQDTALSIIQAVLESRLQDAINITLRNVEVKPSWKKIQILERFL